MDSQRPLRVLSLDGGGMRGTYAASYLHHLSTAFAKRRQVARLDLGAAFDLIVGTSTGAIIACALALGIPLDQVVKLYAEHGDRIFPKQLPNGIGFDFFRQLLTRPCDLERGANCLRTALETAFQGKTIIDVYQERKIALAITAVELSQHKSWVFKTPHLVNSNHRDDGYSLASVCMASSAAPLYRSLEAVPDPGNDATQDGLFKVFADGGLWANNPVLVALTDAIQMAKPGQAIEIFCLGTLPPPSGELIKRRDVNRGLADWKFGGNALMLSIDAQQFAFDNVARMLAQHLRVPCVVTRFPQEPIPSILHKYLALDDARKEARNALQNQASLDANMANSKCGDESNADGQRIRALFDAAPTADH